MFTGIVTDIGKVASVSLLAEGMRLRIETAYDPTTIAIGASIACAGVCLTVVALPESGSNARWFEVEAWEEALRLTTASAWQKDTHINLERALKVGDELGGHIVSGHVDGMAQIVDRKDEGDAVRFILEAPRELAKFIAPKGSVCLDGTSLTVNRVDGSRFDVLLIQHSLQVTTWGDRSAGDSELRSQFLDLFPDWDAEPKPRIMVDVCHAWGDETCLRWGFTQCSRNDVNQQDRIYELDLETVTDVNPTTSSALATLKKYALAPAERHLNRVERRRCTQS